jgi:hypothetical protein
MDARVDKLLELVRKTVLRLFPELAGRYHLTCKARVLSTSGGLHLQPLKRDGSPDPTAPAVKCEPFPRSLKVGDVVRLGFLYGDPSEPHILALSTAAIGTITGSQVNIEGYGVRPALIAEHLAAHFRVGTTTAPVDSEGNPLPGATTSDLTRFDFQTSLKDGDRVAALPIEEGARFIIVAKLP